MEETYIFNKTPKRKKSFHNYPIGLFMLLLMGYMIFNVIYHNGEKVQPATPDMVKTVKFDTNSNKLSKEDSLILVKLLSALPLREHPNYSGYKYTNWDKIYIKKADRKSCYIEYVLNYYIGYGHKQKKSDPAKWWRDFPRYYMTKKEADSLLWVDIKFANAENERLKRLTLYTDVYDIFISGKKLH